MTRNRRIHLALACVAAAAFASAPAASAYAPPASPGKVAKPTGKKKTLTVSKSCASSALNKTCFATIQAAVNATKQTTHKYEYTVSIGAGKYSEFVYAEGHAFDGLTIQGATTDRTKVVIDLAGLSTSALTTGQFAGITPKDNAITINGVSGVSIKNLTVQHYDANGVWIVNAGVPADYVNLLDGAPITQPSAQLTKNELFGGKTYTIDNVTARYGGVYGIFARTSVGGTINNTESYYNNDSGYYIGETPPQQKPVRTTISKAVSWGNELGFSGTHARYVTITKGRWFNNGMGIVPNITMGEHWPPPSFNIITDNDIYGNNFDYYGSPQTCTSADVSTTAHSCHHVGDLALASDGTHLIFPGQAPFHLNGGSLGGGADYPPGIGILAFASQDSEISKNRIWGNKLLGVGFLNPTILINDTRNWKAICGTTASPISSADCTALKNSTIIKRNKVIGNSFGSVKNASGVKIGVNRNGRDILYTNDGQGNCFGGAGVLANTFEGGGTLWGVPTDPTKSAWQTCDKGTYSVTKSGPLQMAYYYALTFADATPASGTTGLGAYDVVAHDTVDNSHHQGRWYVWPGSSSTWPTGFGTPLEICTIAAGNEGCSGQPGAKP